MQEVKNQIQMSAECRSLREVQVVESSQSGSTQLRLSFEYRLYQDHGRGRQIGHPSYETPEKTGNICSNSHDDRVHAGNAMTVSLTALARSARATNFGAFCS